MTLDLVICTYNNAWLLDRTLASLAEQEPAPGVRWTVLVVDNNCTDDTAGVVEAHRAGGRIPGLRRVLEPEQGLTPARLAGVRHTTGDWIAFVDDDCLLQPDWVRQAAAFAAAHPACGGFGGRVVLAWEEEPPAFLREYGYAFAEQDHGDDPHRVGYLVGAGLVLRRAALEACGWTQRQYLADRVGRRLVSGGDMEITLRVHAAGHPLWYHPGCVLRHVITPSRTSLRYLLAMTYGLGQSQQHVDALRWPGSYAAWVRASLRDLARATVHVARQGMRAVVRRRAFTEARITWSFLRGRWAGLGRRLLQGPGGRDLLGQARATG